MMRGIRNIVRIIAFSILITLGSGCCIDTHARIYERSHFKYYYSGQDETIIDKLDERLRLKVRYIQDRLMNVLPGQISIYLALTDQEFIQLTHRSAPGWAGGMAYPRSNRIVVRTPLFFDQGIPLEVLTAHEISHLVIHSITGDNYLPRWFEEGLCQVLAGETRQGSLGRLSRAATADRLMGLPRVDDVLSYSSPDADLAYAESRSAMQYFIDRFGWDKLRDLLTGLKQDGEFAEVFLTVTGIEYEYWQVEWIDYARERYRRAWWINIDNYIWTFTVLLGIIGMSMVLIRRKLQLRRWQDEEDEFDDNEPIHP